MVSGQIWMPLPRFEVAHSPNAASHWIAIEIGIKERARHQSCAAPSQLLQTANISVCPESKGSFSRLFGIFSPHNVISLSTLCCFCTSDTHTLHFSGAPRGGNSMLVPSRALCHLLPARTRLPSLVAMSPSCSQPTQHKQETFISHPNRFFPKMEHSRDPKGSVGASQSKLWFKLVRTSSVWSWFRLHD